MLSGIQAFGAPADILPKGLKPEDSAQQRAARNGAVGQLGGAFNGIEEVVGSVLSGSTKIL